MTPPPGPEAYKARGLRGRQEVLERLTRERARAVSEGETVVDALVGPVGIGKGAVIEAALSEAKQSGFVSFYGRAEALDAPVPLSLIQNALASWSTPENADSSGPSPDGAGALSSLFLGPIAAQEARPTEGSARTRAAYETLLTSLQHHDELVADRRTRLFTRMRAFLADLISTQPVVIALSDLQRADPGSLELVTFLLEGRPRGALWMILAYSSEADLPAAFRRTLERQVAEGRTTRLQLSPLPPEDIRGLILSSAGPTKPPDDILEEIINRAEGAPALAIRLARAYASQGALPDSTPAGSPSLDGVGTTSLSHLSEPEERVLAAAAVTGATFSFDVVLAVVGLPDEEAAELLEGLVHKGIVGEGRGGTYSFPDESLRLQVYKGLSEARRRILHRKVAEALHRLRPGDDPTVVFAIARHATLGRQDALAESYVRRAIAITEAASDTLQGLALTRQAAEVHRRAHPEDLGGLADLLHQVGGLALSVGDEAAAVAALNEAADCLHRAGDLGVRYAAVRLDLARALNRRGDGEKARAFGEEALGIFRANGSPGGEALAQRFMAACFYAAGDYTESGLRLRSAAQLLESSGAPPRDLGRTYTQLADSLVMFNMISNRKEATALFEKGMAQLELGKDYGGILLGWLGRAAFERRLGEGEAAKVSLEKALAVARRMRNPGRFIEITLRRSEIFRKVQDYDEAYALAMMARDYAEGIGDAAGRANATLFAADVAGPLGLTKQVERLVAGALEQAVESKSALLQAEALYRLASYAQAHREPDRARELYAQAQQLGRERSLSPMALALRRELEETWAREKAPDGTP